MFSSGKLSQSHHPFQLFAAQSDGVSVPHSDVACQGAFDGAPVEGGKEAREKSELPQSVERIKELLCFLHNHLGVCRSS